MTAAYRRMLFLAHRLVDVRTRQYAASVEVRFGELKVSDVPSYLRYRPRSDRAEVEQRLARGDRCIVSRVEDEIIDAGWIATGSVHVPYLDRLLEVPAGDVYAYDSYTAPEYRARGVYMARNTFTARLNQREGFLRTIALVAFENYAAWLLLTRFGMETLGAFHYVRLPGGGIRWITTEPGRTLPSLVSITTSSRLP